MRRRKAEKRNITSDSKYNSRLVARFINMIMLDGKKSIAEKIVYEALQTASNRLNKDKPLEILNKAINNVRPTLEVKSRRMGGATYQVPVEVLQDRGITLALRWIRDFSRQKKGKPMQEKLAEQIFQAYKNEGEAVKKKQSTHKMAEANKAFTHYRW